MTPREYRALADQHLAWERRQDARFGQVAMLLANANRDPKERPDPYLPSDFFPSLADGPSLRSSVPEAEPSDEDELRIARSMLGWGQHGRSLYRANLGLPAG